MYLNYENMLNLLKDHFTQYTLSIRKDILQILETFKNIHFLINSYIRIFILPVLITAV